MKKRQGKQRGFTLVEVIVVLVILAILAALLIPAMTRWIDKAKEKTAIVGCRTCVVAAQTLASEQYGMLGRGNVTPTEGDVMALAKIDGSVSGISVNGDNAVVEHLTYADPSGVTVLYCYNAPGCHAQTYTINAGSAASATEALDALSKAFQQAVSGSITIIENGKETNFVGKNIDGVNSNVDNTFAKGMFDSLTPAQQAFLSTTSWSILKTDSGYRLYFTTENHGTGSVKPVTVYKYDMETGKFQKADNGEVKDGKVTGNGTWSEWSDTMD